MISGGDQPRRRSRARGAQIDWFFALALAFFVGVAVWFGRAIYDFFTPSTGTLSTPAFVGQTEGDAIAEAQRLRIRVLVVARSESERYPAGVVMSQQPDAGSQIRQGRQVSLIVSSGLQIFPMPDLRYESLREVNLDLSHYRLVLGKTRMVASTEVQPGHVVGQDPAPLTSARVGTVVNLDVSKGGQQTAKVPNFVGMDVDDARQAASDAGVHLGQVVWTPFGRSARRAGSSCGNCRRRAIDGPLYQRLAPDQRRTRPGRLPRSAGARLGDRALRRRPATRARLRSRRQRDRGTSTTPTPSRARSWTST